MSVMGWLQHQTKRIARKSRSSRLTAGILSVSHTKLVRLPGFGLFVDPDDFLIGRTILQTKSYEPHLAALISRRLKPGQCFLDLGANIGFHTLTAAKVVGPAGRCIAVDLNPDNCALLRASCEFNQFAHVEIHQKAAAAQAGELSFFTTPNSGNSALINDQIRERLPRERQTFGIPRQAEAIAIDDLVGDDPVDLVKMDIEGSEAKALAGMGRLLARQRPPIIFEFFPNMLRDIGEIEPCELLETLRDFGYELHEIKPNGTISARPLSNQEAMPRAGEMLIDLYASPKSLHQ